MSSHFEIRPGSYTDQSVRGVVPMRQAAYQEIQRGGRCFIHAANAMAGYPVIKNPKDLFDIHNEHVGKTLSLDESGLKGAGLFMSGESDLDKHGIDPAVAKKFIEMHKPDFDLDKDTPILISESRVGHKENREMLNSFQKDPSAHRAILGIGGDHFLTVRKDKSGRWRVIDSQTKSHDMSAKDKIKQIQPDFATLQDAVDHVSKIYKSDVCVLIYPKEKSKSKIKKVATVAAISLATLVVGGIAYYFGSRTSTSSK